MNFTCDVISVNYHQNYFKIPIKGAANLTREISLIPRVDLDIDHSEINSPCELYMYTNLNSLLLYLEDIPTRPVMWIWKRKKINPPYHS